MAATSCGSQLVEPAASCRQTPAGGVPPFIDRQPCTDTAATRFLATVILLSVLLGVGCTPEKQDPPLKGLADYHLHQFAYLGFGGNSISHSVDPTTPCVATPSAGSSLSVENLLRKGLFDVASNKFSNGECNPTLRDIASQRVDTDNLKRAWQYGLRLIVVHAVSSEFLCEAGKLKKPCPTDRRAIEDQVAAAFALQQQIDTETSSTTPGLGWYRIVTTPGDARRVIKEGRLAVVLAIEAANAFGCQVEKWTDVPSIRTVPSDTGTEAAYRNNCDHGNLRQFQFADHAAAGESLDQFGDQSTHRALALFEHYRALGVRHFFLTHNIDGVASGTALSIDLLHADFNPSGRTSGSGGPGANRLDEINRVIKAIRPPSSSVNCSSLFPYDGGRCNAVGLTATGRELAKTMAASGVLIDADHISYRAKRELLDAGGVLKGIYPLVSSHSGIASLNHFNSNNEGQLADQDIDAIIRAGGAFAPRLPPVTGVSEEDTFPKDATTAIHDCGGTSESFAQAYRYLIKRYETVRPNTVKPFVAGIGIGTDFGPPIPVFAGPRFHRPQQVVGVIDFNLEGLVIGRPRKAEDWPCFNKVASGNRPMLEYPLTSLSPNASITTLEKAVTPWDGRAEQPGYDISFDGVPHIGMIPDFVEELRVLGLTDQELEPLWHGAEAYIRSWEAAEAWRSEFDAEAKMGVRGQCEADRKKYLESMDVGHVINAVAALRGLKQNRCRGTDAPATSESPPYQRCRQDRECTSGYCANLTQNADGSWIGNCVAASGLGQACANNRHCLSGYCDSGFNTANTNRCMPRGGTGANGEPCSNDTQCTSAFCGNLVARADGTWIPGICTAPGGLGQSCAGNSNCASGYCDRGSNTANTNQCMPRGGTGAPNNPCSHDSQCAVGSCASLAQRSDGSWIPGRCTTSNLGETCSGNSQCGSGYCDRGFNTANTNQCMPRGGTGVNNEPCSHDTQCSSGFCANLARRSDGSWIPGRCAARGDLGQACSANSHCKSGYCDGGFNTANTNQCMPRGGEGAPRDPCSHDTQCRSGACFNLTRLPNGNWIPGQCM